jgi:hypothetical protein
MSESHDTPPGEEARPATAAQTPSTGLVGRVADLVEDAVGGVVEGATMVAGGAVDAARGAVHRWDERPGARVRRVRRRAREPLPSLSDVHPETRQASPHDLGVRTIDVDQIAGTASGSIPPRGGDFLPRKEFRTLNWQGRWQRIRNAIDRLAVLPPIDVMKYGDRYWVIDGHNRVAAALYAGQVGTDANVVELVSPGDAPSEPPAALAAVLTGSRALRTAGAGRKVGPLEHEDEIDRRPEST